MGDAAFALDPITGSGMSRAIEMAEELSQLSWNSILDGEFDQLEQLATRRIVCANELLVRLRHGRRV